MVYYCWVDDVKSTENILLPKAPSLVKNLFSKTFQKIAKAQLTGHGLGRHTQREVYSIARKDLQALSDYLDTKPFVMGQEPSLVDASAFGLMAQFLWQDVGSPQNSLLNGELKNLKEYCERMREKYWSDWDETISQRQKLQ